MAVLAMDHAVQLGWPMTTGRMDGERARALAAGFESTLRRVLGAYTVDLTTTEPTLHVRLVLSDGRAFLLGHVDLTAGRAELRTLGCSLALSKRRFGYELRLPPKEYMRFLDLATKLLEEHGLDVTVVAIAAHREPSAAPPAPPATSAVRRMTLPYTDAPLRHAAGSGSVLS